MKIKHDKFLFMTAKRNDKSITWIEPYGPYPNSKRLDSFVSQGFVVGGAIKDLPGIVAGEVRLPIDVETLRLLHQHQCDFGQIKSLINSCTEAIKDLTRLRDILQTLSIDSITTTLWDESPSPLKWHRGE